VKTGDGGGHRFCGRAGQTVAAAVVDDDVKSGGARGKRLRVVDWTSYTRFAIACTLSVRVQFVWT
jgi:hypothetical protein